MKLFSPSQQFGSKKQAAQKSAMNASCIGNEYLAKRHFQPPPSPWSLSSIVGSSFGSSGSGWGATTCVTGAGVLALPGVGDDRIVIPVAPLEFVRRRCFRLLFGRRKKK